jgi:tight adherence protein C
MTNNGFIYRLYTKKTINRVSKKNKMLGSKYNYNIVVLLTWRFIITIFLFMIFLLLNKVILAFVVSLVYYVGIEYCFFDYRLKKRADKLDREALFYFQILSLTLTSGNNLKNAIELTSNSIDNDLSLEFKKVNEDVKLGKSLNEALDDLKLRIPSDTINNIILNLTESNIYGANMIESLNTQLDYLNDKLLLGIKERINKMPIKISIASVLIFIPIILLIILSPVILKLVNS